MSSSNDKYENPYKYDPLAIPTSESSSSPSNNNTTHKRLPWETNTTRKDYVHTFNYRPHHNGTTTTTTNASTNVSSSSTWIPHVNNLKSILMQKNAWLFILGGFAIGVLSGYDMIVGSNITDADATEHISSFSTSSSLKNNTSSSDLAPTSPKSTMELLGITSKHLSILKDSILRDEYGDSRGLIFDTNLIMNRMMDTKDDISWDVLMRKIMKKVLESRIRLLEHGGDDGGGLVNFIWVTAGDSAAAGHGNMIRQSYTAIIENTIKEAFASIGINFIAKNYAMGGGQTYQNFPPELSVCMETIYGSDIDIFSWDYKHSNDAAITIHTRLWLWAKRAALHPSKPTILFMGGGDDSEISLYSSDQWNMLDQILSSRQKHGLSSRVFMDKFILERRILHGRLMDTNHVLQQGAPPPPPNNNNLDDGTNVQQQPPPPPITPQSYLESVLPPPLQYFKCNGNVEGVGLCQHRQQGDDTLTMVKCDDLENGIPCLEHKYNTRQFCGEEQNMKPRYQNSGNPGWKYHLLKGRILGYFLLNLLHESLMELHEFETQQPRHTKDKNLLKLLQQKETEEQPHHEEEEDDVAETTEAEQTFTEMDHILFTKRSICHTALLPSDVSSIAADDTRTGYEEGISSIAPPLSMEDVSPQEEQPPKQLPLVSDPKERQSCPGLNFDYKDYFIVRQTDDWVGLTFPTNEELNTYHHHHHHHDGSGSSSKEGIIMICLRKCTPEIRGGEACPTDNIIDLEMEFGNQQRRRRQQQLVEGEDSSTQQQQPQEEEDNTAKEEIAPPQSTQPPPPQISILVDDTPVQSVQKVLDDCYILLSPNEESDNMRWKPKHLELWQYDLRFKVFVPNGELHISSIITF